MLHSKTAQSWLAELRATRVQYVQAVERIDAAILALEGVAEYVKPTHEQKAPTDVHEQGTQTRIRPRTKPQKVRGRLKAIARILRKSGRQELSVRQILEGLRVAGVPVKTKNPYRTVYRAMKTSPQFHSKHGSWTLVANLDNSSTSGDGPRGSAEQVSNVAN